MIKLRSRRKPIRAKKRDETHEEKMLRKRIERAQPFLGVTDLARRLLETGSKYAPHQGKRECARRLA